MTGNISAAQIAGAGFAFVICALLPFALCLVFCIKWRRRGALKFVLAGAAALFVSQVVLRIPLLQNVLPSFAWYSAAIQIYPWAYIAFLSVTAGLFEESARLAALSILKSGADPRDGIAYTLGHAGFEAIATVGMSMLSTLGLMLSVNSGAFEAYYTTLGEAYAEALYNALLQTPAVHYFLGALERVFVFAGHLAFTYIVMEGFRRGKKAAYWAIAVGAHTLFNFIPLAIGQIMGQSELGLYIQELAIVLMSVAAGYYAFLTYRKYTRTEKEKENVQDQEGNNPGGGTRHKDAARD